MSTNYVADVVVWLCATGYLKDTNRVTLKKGQRLYQLRLPPVEYLEMQPDDVVAGNAA